jgi:hypothetical protein
VVVVVVVPDQVLLAVLVDLVLLFLHTPTHIQPLHLLAEV